VTEQTRLRITHILDIHAALEGLLPVRDRADAWVHQPNQAFGGRTALSHMLQGQVRHLKEVADHLAGFCGGDFA
ncbi:antitoxin Xre/MbcA/ParS toxin-binding domain-containing protein, partial [Nostoc sp. NIES-2111]